MTYESDVSSIEVENPLTPPWAYSRQSLTPLAPSIPLLPIPVRILSSPYSALTQSPQPCTPYILVRRGGGGSARSSRSARRYFYPRALFRVTCCFLIKPQSRLKRLLILRNDIQKAGKDNSHLSHTSSVFLFPSFVCNSFHFIFRWLSV